MVWMSSHGGSQARNWTKSHSSSMLNAKVCQWQNLIDIFSRCMKFEYQNRNIQTQTAWIDRTIKALIITYIIIICDLCLNAQLNPAKRCHPTARREIIISSPHKSIIIIIFFFERERDREKIKPINTSRIANRTIDCKLIGHSRMVPKKIAARFKTRPNNCTYTEQLSWLPDVQ